MVDCGIILRGEPTDFSTCIEIKTLSHEAVFVLCCFQEKVTLQLIESIH